MINLQYSLLLPYLSGLIFDRLDRFGREKTKLLPTIEKTNLNFNIIVLY